MLKICLLNSVAPKLQPASEKLAIIRNWYSDGYRTSVPGTSVCTVTDECENGESCQSGRCTSISSDYEKYH